MAFDFKTEEGEASKLFEILSLEGRSITSLQLYG